MNSSYRIDLPAISKLRYGIVVNKHFELDHCLEMCAFYQKKISISCFFFFRTINKGDLNAGSDKFLKVIYFVINDEEKLFEKRKML